MHDFFKSGDCPRFIPVNAPCNKSKLLSPSNVAASENALTAAQASSTYSFQRHGSDLQAMDAKDHGESSSAKNSICSLEWIAWAMEAARRHKEAEHQGCLEPLDDEPGDDRS